MLSAIEAAAIRSALVVSLPCVPREEIVVSADSGAEHGEPYWIACRFLQSPIPGSDKIRIGTFLTRGTSS